VCATQAYADRGNYSGGSVTQRCQAPLRIRVEALVKANPPRQPISAMLTQCQTWRWRLVYGIRNEIAAVSSKALPFPAMVAFPWECFGNTHGIMQYSGVIFQGGRFFMEN
jgi:hypothetical protein